MNFNQIFLMVSNQRNQLAYGYNTDLKKISEIGFGL